MVTGIVGITEITGLTIPQESHNPMNHTNPINPSLDSFLVSC